MSRWKPGECIAERFTIEGWLASGGMAEIYVAKMTLARGVERRVALKRIHSNLAEDPHFISMFLEEARVVSQLVHPGVIPVHDIVDAEGELLLVLDYVPGWDLSTVVKKLRELGRPISIGAAVFVGSAVAETLSYVHGAVDIRGVPLGIVHRDVNPSNILIAEDGTLRLLDFGVAKAVRSTQHTATRGIKGKLAYLAPEQARNGVVDARTDLYGLGLILWEMIGGARALRASGDIALLDVARSPAIPRVSSLRPEVPELLDALIARLLAVDPGARPASALQVVRALESTRALVTDTTRDQVRAMVTQAMGTPARVAKAAQRPLDAALAAVAELDVARPRTAVGGARSLFHAASPQDATPRDATPRNATPRNATPMDPVHHDPTPVDPAPRAFTPAQASLFGDLTPRAPPREDPPALDDSVLAAPTFVPAVEAMLDAARRDPAPFDDAIFAAPTFIPAAPSPAPAPEPVISEPIEPPTALTPPRSSKRIAAAFAVLAIATAAWTLARTRAEEATPATDPPPSAPAPARAFLRITSQPPGASIALDGRATGERTPAVLEAAPGQAHPLQLELDDYLPTSTTAWATEARTKNIELHLSRRPGKLIIHSDPSGATVTIDGRKAGTTPLTLENLDRRPLTLHLEAPNYHPKDELAPLDQHPEITLEIKLDREIARGYLDISSTPWARVEIDGRPVAESTPVMGLELPAGEHQVTLSNPRIKRTAKRTVVIRRGERASLIIRL